MVKKKYKVSERTVYRHFFERGMVQPDVEKKWYSLKAVLRYAKTHLKPVGTVKKKKAGELQERKLTLEIELQEEKLAFERIKRLREEGRYIDSERSDLETASKLGAYEAALKGMVQLRAGDYVSLVNGDERKIPDLVRMMTEDIDQTGNEIASRKNIEGRFE